jgi:hypothetical protein
MSPQPTARDEWGEFSKYAAHGVPGSKALAAELERIVRETGIKVPHHHPARPERSAALPR